MTGWEAKRQHMVESQLRYRNLHDERVLEAMATIPRELFLTSTVNPYKLLISKGLLFLLGTTFSFSDETPDHF